MHSNDLNHPIIKKSNNKFSKLTLIAIIFICIAPILASYLTYYYFKPTSKINHGILIEPQKPLPKLQLDKFIANNNINTITSLTELKGKWILMITSTAKCDDECAKLLYTIRQLRHSQGKNANRIVPVWLINDNEIIEPVIIQAYNDNLGAVKFAKLNQDSKATLNQWLNIESLNNKYNINKNIYLIDPNQNLMMYYTPEHSPQGMIKDITKLLKWSRIG